jgi:hypothetical protein
MHRFVKFPFVKIQVVSMVTAALLAGAILFAPAASALSAKQFRAAADAVCRGGTASRTELLQQHFPNGVDQKPSVAQITAFVGDYKKVVKQQIDALAALKPPANLKAKMSKLLSTARTALARVVAKPTLLIAGSDPFASVNKQSIALGLTDCAS